MDFDILPTDAYINRMHQEKGVVRGYFYMVSLESGLRFLHPNFIIDILNDYKIASS